MALTSGCQEVLTKPQNTLAQLCRANPERSDGQAEGQLAPAFAIPHALKAPPHFFQLI